MCEIHSNEVGNAKSFGSRKISLYSSMCRSCHMDRVLVMMIRKLRFEYPVTHLKGVRDLAARAPAYVVC